VIVTMATEDWVQDCVERAGDDALAAEVAQTRVIYARQIQGLVEVWPRRNEPIKAALNFGNLICSKTWEMELRAQLISAKMASVRSAMPEGCRQVISIGDSEIERWAVHDLPFEAEELAHVLVKTIKFEEELDRDSLREMLQTTTGLLSQFVRLNTEMDVDLRAGDPFFPMDLQFAMRTATRPDPMSGSAPQSPTAGMTPFAEFGTSRRSPKWSGRSHEL
jgi:hypothetical protein